VRESTFTFLPFPYLPEIQRIFPGYKKGELSVDFITWDALKNLKRNLSHQPMSNPNNLQGLRGFANFLIDEIERAYHLALMLAGAGHAISAVAPTRIQQHPSTHQRTGYSPLSHLSLLF